MTDGTDIAASFIRQRRNLMIVSLVLLFAESAELTIEKLNIFGNELRLAHPETATYALWIGWIYWLWRYYVYFHDLGEKGFLREYHKRMLELVRQVALFQLKRDPQFIKDHADKGRTTIAIPKSAMSFYERSSLRYVVKIGGEAYSPKDDNVSPGEFRMDRYIVDNRPLLILANIRAWLYVLLRTHLLSEYLLPYLVAASPLFYRALILMR